MAESTAWANCRHENAHADLHASPPASRAVPGPKLSLALFRWNGVRFTGAGRGPPPQPVGKPVEIQINHGRREKRQGLADDEAADNGVAEWLTDFRSSSGSQHQWQSAEDRRHGRH